MNEVNNTQEMPNVKDPLNSATIENANLNSEEYFKNEIERLNKEAKKYDFWSEKWAKLVEDSKLDTWNTNTMSWYNPLRLVKGISSLFINNAYEQEENQANFEREYETINEKRKATYNTLNELRAKYNEYLINKKAALEKYDIEKQAMSKLGVTNPHTILNYMKGIAPNTNLNGAGVNYSFGEATKKKKIEDSELDITKILLLLKFLL